MKLSIKLEKLLENKKTLNKARILSDQKSLIDGLKAQKSVAFDALYTKYASTLYGIILQIVQHKSIAQQTLEQVFIAIWNNIEQYNATNSNFVTWIRSIAHTLAHQHNEKNNGDFKGNPQNVNSDEISSKNTEEIKNNQNFQTQFLVSKEEEEPTNHKISHKIIIDLLYFRGYSVETIATEFHLSIENTKNIVRIALNQLKEKY